MPDTLLRTPLHDAHLASGAKMVPFAGYEMPVQYTGGIIAESMAVREGAGMFDVSHMARLKFTGQRVHEYLEWVTANDISKLSDNEGQYSLLPNFLGGCVDDIIVYRINPTEFRMVVNAANHAKDVSWLKEQNSMGIEMEDYTDRTAMIAVQGPKAISILRGLCDRPGDLESAPAFGVVEGNYAGVTAFAARSGYTGEDGYELVCPAEHADTLWNALLAAGVVPCGLGSRDVLRVEAGLPLYGHELGDEMSPISAGLGWVISKSKSFIGSDIINRARSEGTPTKLQGVKLNSKRLPQPGMKVVQDGLEIGEVSSGIYSPTFGVGAAFAFLDAAVKQGTDCALDLRGKLEPATVVNKRFFRRN